MSYQEVQTQSKVLESWNIRPWQVTPEVNSNVLEREWVVGSPPPAFDLFLERERILRDGEVAKQSFIENAHRYVSEHVAGVVNTEFAPYYINFREDGLIMLTTPGYTGSVSEIYNPARADWPEYRNDIIQRERAETEYRTFANFEKSDDLRNARVGDRFLWLSPPPTEYLNRGDIDGLRKLGYGFHSFAFLYEVKTDEAGGGNYIESRAIRHYLRACDQGKLLNEVSHNHAALLGKDPSDIELLSQIVKVNKTAYDSEKLLADIHRHYSATPENLRIKPPMLPEWSGGAIGEVGVRLNKWLEGIFYLMDFDRGRSSDGVIEVHFRGWENALKDLMTGGEVKIEDIEDPKLWALIRLSGRVRDKRDNSLMGGYIDREYKPTAGGCGEGAAFGNKKKAMATTYSSAEGDKSFTGKCPVCNTEVRDLQVGEHCPGCNTEYLCA